MSLTVQNIVDAVSTDVRKVLNNSGSDATLMIGWVDRIHKDLLHNGIYHFLTDQVSTITTVAGTSQYAVTFAQPIRQILLVYDRTFNRELLDVRAASAPQSQGNNGPNPGEEQLRSKITLDHKTQMPWPEYYKLVGTNQIYLFPAPQSPWIGTIEIYSDTQVSSLANLTDVLVIPEDGKDALVAGVNWMAMSYLKFEGETARWMQVYEMLKRGEVQSQ